MKDRDERSREIEIRTLQIRETRRTKETKLIRFLRQLIINQSRCFTVIMKKQEKNQVVIQTSCSVHCQRTESDWVWVIQVDVPIKFFIILFFVYYEGIK